MLYVFWKAEGSYLASWSISHVCMTATHLNVLLNIQYVITFNRNTVDLYIVIVLYDHVMVSYSM